MTSEQKDLGWLRDQVIALFAQAVADEPDHAVCVKYAEILMKLLPGAAGTGGVPRGTNGPHPDADTIAAVRLAIQQSTHPVPRSQTEP